MYQPFYPLAIQLLFQMLLNFIFYNILFLKLYQYKIIIYKALALYYTSLSEKERVDMSVRDSFKKVLWKC